MFLFLFFKYCADVKIFLFFNCAGVENCGASKGFGFIYILVLCPCDARLNKKSIYKLKKYFFSDNIIKSNNK